MAIIQQKTRTKSSIVDVTTDGTAVTVYSCPLNAKSHMNLLFITNAGSNASDISIDWYRASQTTTYAILGGKNLSAGEYIQFSHSFIVLESGDTISITTSNTAGAGIPDVHCFCTVEEFFIPVG